MKPPHAAAAGARTAFAACALVLALSLLGLAAVGHQHELDTFGVSAGLPDPDLAPRPPSLLGVNVALEQYADPAPAMRHLEPFHWLRQTFAWDQIEPVAGRYYWDEWDRVVTLAAESGHEVIAVLNFSPAWAREPTRPRTAPPQSAQHYAAFAAAFARRYGHTIDVYQIWDEPNLQLGWGDQPPSAADYAALLKAAYAAIHTADPSATVLAAGLAPTVETGPDNVSDLLYLQQLYDLGAAPYFDGAAGKPYGFYTGPDDRLTDPGVLNFSRFVLLRQVMERNGDGRKLLWASNFGWSTLASPWGQATPGQQVAYTQAAYQRAATEWPWAGALVLENYQPLAAHEDPHWGFALADPDGRASPLLEALPDGTSVTGNFDTQHPAAAFGGAWEFSELGADIPVEYEQAAITITFSGSDLALRVRRGNYRGYLYVEVDGQPAPLLPRDERGAYLVLTSPTLAPEVVTVPVAAALAPGRAHTAVIRPERGWDQWAFVGFSVGQVWPGTRTYRALVVGLGLLAGLALAGAVYFGRRLDWAARRQRAGRAWQRLGDTGQLVLTAAASAVLYATSWLTWGHELVAVTRRFGDTWPLALTALSAGLFYFSPSLVLALLSLTTLFVLFYLRLDLALAFAAFFVPFYLQYQLLWERGFAMVEVCVLLGFAAFVLHSLRPALARLAANGRRARDSAFWSRFSLADWAVLTYFIVASLSTGLADQRVVAIREYRLVIVEPILLYVVARGVRLDQRGLWRLIDFFILGAVAVALIGLFEYVTGADPIIAEGGLVRLRSVYGSPNNLALYLGRALPLAFAVALLGHHRPRRAAYGLAALILALAAALTFSKGALLLGVPAALGVVLIGWLGRRAIAPLAAALVAGVAALPLLARLPRFASLVDFSSGSSFFRLRLWVSAWRMFRAHPLLGVGPDNFLYEYRSRFILPEAWAEPDLSHPHNLLLDFLTRLGSLGLLSGALLQIAFWREAFISRRQLAAVAVSPESRDFMALNLGLMALMTDMLAHGLVDHGFFLVDLAYVFFLALAVAQHLARLTAPTQPPGSLNREHQGNAEPIALPAPPRDPR